MQNNCNWITPKWPAPLNVKALTTVREGGYSSEPYDSFNLALHVGDNPKTVLANRALLKANAHLPTEPFWLTQTHSITVAHVQDTFSLPVEADASIAFKANQVCAVLTGDCLPILLCDKQGTCVSAIHAGWKGLAAGIIEETLKELKCGSQDLLAWLGPAIGYKSYEVKEDFLLAFKEYHSDTTFHATSKQGVWLADLYQLAKARLNRLGVNAVFGGEYCTYQDAERFYSARRSKTTGRMATLIWLTAP